MRVKLIDRERAALVAIAAQRVGWKKAAQVMDTVVGWESAVRTLQREVTTEEWAEHWGVPKSTAYRRLDVFREAFPEVRYPHDLMRPLLLALAEQKTLPADLSWVDGLVS